MPRRAGHRFAPDQRIDAAVELAIQDEQREPAVMIHMQVRNDHDGNLAGVDTLAFERDQTPRTAVQQDRRLVATLHCDGGLQAVSASECISGSGKHHHDIAIVGRRHRVHQTNVADRIIGA
jgi:hypothetical protein